MESSDPLETAITTMLNMLDSFEEVIREDMRRIEQFNHDAPLTPGLTLHVFGERRSWPASVEREDAMLWMASEIRRLVSERPSDLLQALTRLADRLIGEIRRRTSPPPQVDDGSSRRWMP